MGAQRMRRRGGFMVAVVVTSLAVLFGLAAAIIAVATGCLQLSVVNVHMEKSRFAAEAGLAAGLDRIARQPAPLTWPWRQTMSTGDQSFEVMVYDNSLGSGRIPSFDGGPEVPAEMVYVVSTGYCKEKYPHRVGSLVRKGDGGFQVGAVAKYFYFAPGSTIDAYDSRDGRYGEAPLVENTNLLATNANAAPNATTKAFDSDAPLDVKGKIFLGTSGLQADMVSPGVTSDGFDHLARAIDLPEITLPEGLPTYPDVSRSGVGAYPDLEPGEYDEVYATAGASVRLKPGGVYRIRRLDIYGGKLEIHGGNATVYVTDYLSANTPGALVNSSEKAKNLQLNYTGTGQAYVAGGASAYFTLLAPNAMIDASNGDIHGALMTQEGIEFTSSSRFHYDVSLQNLQTGTAITFQVLNRHRI